ncbi:MAG: YncE family protein [Schleiferiaceae bacterium]
MKHAHWVVLGLAALSSCDPSTPISPFESGLYVLNEGAFMGGTATITYLTSGDSVVHDAFSAANGRSLGNLGNSIMTDGSRMFVVLNGAASVEVMDYPGLKSVGRITGFASPRHAVKLPNGDLAVTDWGRNFVYRVRSLDWTIADSVDVGQGPEAMVSHLDELWVSMSGAYGIDSALMVLDASTLEVLDTVYVGVNPTSMLRIGSMLYVLSSGYTDWSGGGGDRAASLSLVDLGTRTEIKRHPATNAADRPAKLQSDGQVLYWIRDGYTGDVLRMNPADHEYPTTPFISGSAYGIFADPATRNLYVLDAKDFQQPGEGGNWMPACPR